MEKFFENYYKFISNQFSSSISQKIINGFNKKRYTTFRVNTLKANSENIIEDILNRLKKEKIEFKKSSFLKNAFYFLNLNESKALKLPIVNEGLIYLQSFSSMIPAYLINPEENEKILDITAAPGSKTTLISALSNNKAIIYANEKDKIRYERLKYNVDLLGCNVNLINEKAERLGEIFTNIFDKVLVDAPCSGEGRFLKSDKSTYFKWSEKEVEKNYILQKKILNSALKTLKESGLCVYSTCTLNKIENEKVIAEIIQNYEIKPIKNIEFFNNIPDVHIEYIDIRNLSLPVYRILPSEYFEGFTIILFTKLKNRY
ncbi:MAG: hypothetical protein ACK4YF_02515 [Exilispira sp.]